LCLKPFKTNHFASLIFVHYTIKVEVWQALSVNP